MPGRHTLLPKDVPAEADAHRELLRSVVDADQPDWTGVLRVHGLGHDQGHWADNMALVGPDGVALVDVARSR